MKRGYNRDTNLYPRGNASPLVRVDENGMVDGKLLYPPWWERFVTAYEETARITLAVERVGIHLQTLRRWQHKCPHLDAEIVGIQEMARQQRYDDVRATQLEHRDRLQKMGRRIDQHPEPEGDINAIRAMDVITRGLDTERKAAERQKQDGVQVAIQNNQNVGLEMPKAVYTDAERDEIADILKDANGQVVEGEIVEAD